MAISKMANSRVFTMFRILVVMLIPILGSLAVNVTENKTTEGEEYSEDTWNEFLKFERDHIYQSRLYERKIDLNNTEKAIDKEEAIEKPKKPEPIKIEDRNFEIGLHKITHGFPRDFGWSGLVLGIGSILGGWEMSEFKRRCKVIKQNSLVDYTIPYITTSETEKIKHFLMKKRSKRMNYLQMIVNGAGGLIVAGGLATILATPIREHWIDKPYVRSVGLTVMGCGLLGLYSLNYLLGEDKNTPKKEYYTIDEIIVRWKNKPYRGFVSDHLTEELRNILLELDEAKAQILLHLQNLSRDGISWLLGYEYSCPQSIRDKFPQIDELLVIENMTSKKLRQIWAVTGNVLGSNMSVRDYKLQACWGMAVYGAMNSLGKLEAKLKRIMREIKKEKKNRNRAEHSNYSSAIGDYVSKLSQKHSKNREHDRHHGEHLTDLSLRSSHIAKSEKSSNGNVLSKSQYSEDPVSMIHSHVVSNKSARSRAESY